MIQSMTGYGKSILQLPTKKVTIEIKSLNSKNIDLNTRIPSYYKEKDMAIRKILAKALTRGKVDFSIYIESTGEETSTQINEGIVAQYIKQLQQISPDATPVDCLSIAMRLPDTTKTTKEDLDVEEWKQIENGINEALQNIAIYRTDEGKTLEKEFLFRINNIAKLLDEVIAIDPDRIEGVRQRLEKGIAEIKEKVDENRFEQELVYYIEKFDITEEKVRLKNHLDYFISAINSEDSNGKKLAFISQEMGREINTIGSKSNYAPMQKLVVQMKDELEKIKEQLLNVL